MAAQYFAPFQPHTKCKYFLVQWSGTPPISACVTVLTGTAPKCMSCYMFGCSYSAKSDWDICSCQKVSH